MAENKTQKTTANVSDFLHALPDEKKRQDGFTLVELMRQITGAEPTMWGPAIIGFGDTHYKYASGREGDWFQVGFSPRKQNLALYGIHRFDGFEELLGKLGKHKTGGGCIYVNKLSDVNLDVLKEMISSSIQSQG